MGQNTDRLKIERAAALSVLAAFALTSLKFVVGITSGSLGILSEALHSGIDLLAAGVTFGAVRAAGRAPDSEHMYGHGKIESFAALTETALLWITSGWIIFEAWRRIVFHEFPEATIWGIVVMVISIIVDYERSRMLYRTAEEFNSQALEADALHFSTDILSSTVVLIGLGFVWFSFPIGDPIAAMGVSLIILVVSFRLAKRAYDELVDRAPAGIKEQIEEICKSTSGVLKCERVRVRGTTTTLFVDIVVIIPDSLPLSRAHAIAEHIERKVAELHKSTDIVIHMEPTRCGKHARDIDTYSKIQKIANAHPLIETLHNLRIYLVGEELNISADVEMSDHLSLKEAHRISEELEDAIRKAVPSVSKIAFHLESTEPEEVSYDVTAKRNEIVRSVTDIAQNLQEVSECREVRVFEDKNGLTVSLTCLVDSELPLRESHLICREIERRIKQVHKEVTNAVVHLEPN